MALPDAADEALGQQKIIDSLHWKTGDIDLRSGLARIHLSDDFAYLDSEDTDKVLQVWGNPSNENTLGLIAPRGISPLDPRDWAVIITYEENGYVKDDDESKINYDDLLKQLKQQVEDGNSARRSQGLRELELIGWAAPPHYDKQTHKLYWAQELKAKGEQGTGLNYNIRILGRRGVLVLNAIAGMNQFDEIQSEAPKVLAMVEFNQGSRYADFDPTTDKVAEYGIAALITGGVLAGAAKLGLLKLVWVALVAGWKYVAIGLVAASSVITNWWKKISGNSKKEL